MANTNRYGKRRRRPRSRRVFKAYMILITGISILVLALPTVIVTLVGMVPTLVTLIVDLTPGRYAVRCVTALNFAGTMPFLIRLWGGQNDLDSAFKIIADPNVWLFAYGAAAFGWGLFFSLPGAISATKMFNARRRSAALRERQGRLIHEWGKGIAGEHWRGFSDDVAYFEDDDDQPLPDLAGQEPSPDPAGQEPLPDPAGQEPSPDPAGQEPLPDPAGQEPSPDPAGQEPLPDPAGQEPPPDPAGEETPPPTPPERRPPPDPTGDDRAAA